MQKVDLVIDNTSEAMASPMFREAILDAIKYHGGMLCEELADLFVISKVVGNLQFPETTFRVDWV